jgi:hypothetical protein
MFSEQECESKIRCPECNEPMYALKGALCPIFICSHCGTSIDEHSIEKKQREEERVKKQNVNQPLLRNLFPNQFMKKYTNFTSFSEFILNCKLFNDTIDNLSKDEIANVPERKINRYVRKNTSFSTWDQMFQKAVEWYLKM